MALLTVGCMEQAKIYRSSQPLLQSSTAASSVMVGCSLERGGELPHRSGSRIGSHSVLDGSDEAAKPRLDADTGLVKPTVPTPSSCNWCPWSSSQLERSYSESFGALGSESSACAGLTAFVARMGGQPCFQNCASTACRESSA